VTDTCQFYPPQRAKDIKRTGRTCKEEKNVSFGGCAILRRAWLYFLLSFGIRFLSDEYGRNLIGVGVKFLAYVAKIIALFQN
jgi:hypothetical protein